MKLFDFSHVSELNAAIKGEIIGLVSDQNVILKMLNNENIMNGFADYQVVDIVQKLNAEGKKQLLNNQDFLEKNKINKFNITRIISSLGEDARAETLMDVDLMKNKLQMENYYIVGLVKGQLNEKQKMKALETYQFSNHEKIDVLKTLNAKTLSEFLVEHKELNSKIGLPPYEIIIKLDAEQQKEFVTYLENMDLPLNGKREILATLKTEVKKDIDTTNLPQEFKSALSMQSSEQSGKIVLDLERDLEDYRGLENTKKDKLLAVASIYIWHPKNF